jgi:hypothetical protein
VKITTGIREYPYFNNSIFVGNTIAATRLANNTVFTNVEAFETSIQQAKDNGKKFSRIGVNAAKSFEEISETMAAISL